MTLNACGVGNRVKQRNIANLCTSNKISFLGIQETQMTSNDLFTLRNLWGNFAFDYTVSYMRGRSGGIVSMWDPTVFIKDGITCTDNTIIVHGEWIFSKFKCYMVNVYERKKRDL